jgi:glycosyltransferase involved in cell wall biosynthesis
MIVCIGPRIFKEWQSTIGQNYSEIKVVQFVPGLNARLLAKEIDVSKIVQLRCFFAARMDDYKLKGADFACEVIQAVQTAKNWGIGKEPILILRGFEPHSDDAEKDPETIVKKIVGTELPIFIKCRKYSAEPGEVEDDIRGSGLVIMPSRMEGFGLVALEGIAAGVPVLVTSTSGLGELLMHLDGQVGGSLCASCVAHVVVPDPSAAVKDWAGKMTAIFGDIPSAFAKANELRKRLAPILSWEKAAKNFSVEIDNLLSGLSANDTQ